MSPLGNDRNNGLIAARLYRSRFLFAGALMLAAYYWTFIPTPRAGLPWMLVDVSMAALVIILVAHARPLSTRGRGLVVIALAALLPLVCFYWLFLEATNSIHQWPSEGVFVLDAATAAIVVVLLSSAWSSGVSGHRLFVVVLAAMLLNTIGVILTAYGAMLVYAMLDEGLRALGLTGMSDAWLFSIVGLISGVCAVLFCFLLHRSKMIVGVTSRTYAYCGALCTLAAAPYLSGLDLDSIMLLGIHKGLWISLFGLGLCFGISPHVETDNQVNETRQLDANVNAYGAR
ncbi:MAG: hypothetical protein AAAFM81_05280 [Pseudomonadota bacterium]